MIISCIEQESVLRVPISVKNVLELLHDLRIFHRDADATSVNKVVRRPAHIRINSLLRSKRARICIPI
jgi:hypothetical protein